MEKEENGGVEKEGGAGEGGRREREEIEEGGSLVIALSASSEHNSDLLPVLIPNRYLDTQQIPLYSYRDEIHTHPLYKFTSQH